MNAEEDGLRKILKDTQETQPPTIGVGGGRGEGGRKWVRKKRERYSPGKWL